MKDRATKVLLIFFVQSYSRCLDGLHDLKKDSSDFSFFYDMKIFFSQLKNIFVTLDFFFVVNSSDFIFFICKY